MHSCSLCINSSEARLVTVLGGFLWQVWVETVSWYPRAFVYHNFMTAEECEHLINLGKPSMVKSSVVDNDTGKSVDSRWAA
jgi:hypothetical protein